METMDDRRTVRIDAHMTESFPPDEMRTTITFRGTYSTRQACMEAYSEDLASFVSTATELGVPEDAIVHQPLQVFPRIVHLYEKDEASRYYIAAERIEGYGYHAVSVVLLDATAEQYALIAQVLRAAEGEFSHRTTFDLSDSSSAEESLLAAAVSRARRRAGILTEAAGARIGGIARIEHSFSYDAGKSGPGIAERGVLMAAHQADREPERSPLFAPDDIDISCSVTATWLLEG